MEDKKIDFSNLEIKLAELNAQAFQRAERVCRMAADPTPDIIYSSNFRARLAAEALGVEFRDIMALNLSEFTSIVSRTLNFLLQNLGAEILDKS
ncbi:hypothetical protein SAMN02745671_02634 [Anaerovibrio lipolyticus DSM 3074]|uniref:Uncharacterized protein n=2 Tax=Anaerovibrio lipolyticus TaxID=82374 RepID=A0A0B2JY96_9FIRM|nr:hypothetical protein [Anaerovibrio lipolyticus]KHM53235.1 hypothetical protein NZ47_00005 [Anaerovibrio lipolyticus]SHJ08491.1 hypothetical protein SAMN02745671_02634 [Anaerovibrio lipolyticus DSM 3074]